MILFRKVIISYFFRKGKLLLNGHAWRQMTDQPGAFLGTGFLMIRLYQSAHSHAPGVFPDNRLYQSAHSHAHKKVRVTVR